MLCLTMSDEQDGQVDRPDADHWLPLDAAVRALGISERALLRLISHGMLRSRERADGHIEIWVSAAENGRDVTPQSLEIIEREQPLAYAERISTTSHHQVEALLAPLAASYERNIQLARENGALSTRVASLEFDLQATRDVAAAEKKDLEATRARLRAIETSTAQLEARLNAPAERQPQRQGRRWPWLVLILVVLLALVLGVAWFVLQLR
jgi:hypothetical protein